MTSRRQVMGSDLSAVTKPRVGLKPTTVLSSAGWRMLSRVSVPKMAVDSLGAVATAEPELLPPNEDLG